MLLTSRRSAAVAALLATLLAVVAACGRVPGIYTYESAGQAKSQGGPASAEEFVDDNWQSKIVPTVHDKATDIATVAAAIDKDPDAAGKQYGHQTGPGSPYAFMVKGTGTVTKVDTESPTGPMTVELPNKKIITIATGPVIAGTAVRDAVGFIAFGDFTNQIEYADVANQINNRVKTDVIAKADPKSLTGKKITFYGAFSALAGGAIFLVPTEIQVAA
jgi:predicted lipoprotein